MRTRNISRAPGGHGSFSGEIPGIALTSSTYALFEQHMASLATRRATVAQPLISTSAIRQLFLARQKNDGFDASRRMVALVHGECRRWGGAREEVGLGAPSGESRRVLNPPKQFGSL